MPGALGLLPGRARHVQRRRIAAVKQQHDAGKSAETPPIPRQGAADIEDDFGGIGIAFFHRDQHRLARRLAIACLRIVSGGFVFFAYGLVLTQAFNGAGDTWTPTWINLGCFWLWQIPLAWLLAIRFAMGPQGVFIAMTVAFSTLAIVSGVIFRRGWWKQSKV